MAEGFSPAKTDRGPEKNRVETAVPHINHNHTRRVGLRQLKALIRAIDCAWGEDPRPQHISELLQWNSDQIEIFGAIQVAIDNITEQHAVLLKKIFSSNAPVFLQTQGKLHQKLEVNLAKVQAIAKSARNIHLPRVRKDCRNALLSYVKTLGELKTDCTTVGLNISNAYPETLFDNGDATSDEKAYNVSRYEDPIMNLIATAKMLEDGIARCQDPFIVPHVRSADRNIATYKKYVRGLNQLIIGIEEIERILKNRRPFALKVLSAVHRNKAVFAQYADKKQYEARVKDLYEVLRPRFRRKTALGRQDGFSPVSINTEYRFTEKEVGTLLELCGQFKAANLVQLRQYEELLDNYRTLSVDEDVLQLTHKV